MKALTSLSVPHASVVIVLLVVPTLILLVPHGGSVPYHILVLVALLWRHPPGWRSLRREEQLACIGYAAFTMTILISLVDTGFREEAVKDLDVQLRPLWAIPLLFLFVRTQPREGLLWFGLAAGAILAGLNSIYEVAEAGRYIRTDGATSAITHGNTAFLMGVMAAIALPYFHRLGRPYALLPIGALVLGITASLLSGSRGGWVALPFLLLFLVWRYWQPQYRRLAIAGAASLGIIAAVAASVPQSGVHARIDEAASNVAQYMENPSAGARTSVGTRLELWRAAWDQFTERPMLGGGIGHSFKFFLREGVEAGVYHQTSGVQTMPHNVLLDTLALRGLTGLAGLLALWGTLAWVFVTAARTASPDRRQLGIAGLAMLLGYGLFGLTESVMHYGPPLVFFCLYSALIVHLIARSDDANGITPFDANAQPPAEGQQ